MCRYYDNHGYAYARVYQRSQYIILMRASDNCGRDFTPMRGYDNGGRFVTILRGYIKHRHGICLAVLVLVFQSAIVFVVSALLMVLLPLLSCYCHLH